MAIFDKGFITLSDLYRAYRKAKVDAFYEKTHFSAINFAKYEQQLSLNLKQLYKLLNSRERWVNDTEFLGGYSYIPKSVKNSVNSHNPDVHFSTANPTKDWLNNFKKNDSMRFKANFRLIINPSVNFHIISALWILKVGHLYEERLDAERSYGNRLRRHKEFSFYGKTYRGGVNEDSLSLFEPYFSAYQSWRENGLMTMRRSLEEGKSIVAVTMDIEQFYHRVNPDFLLRKDFLEKLGLELSRDQIDFTRDIIQAIHTWYRETPDFLDRQKGAIPVGLSASKIISNVLLTEFDATVYRKIKPLYYGRYVDDIFLVVEANKQYESGKEFIYWLSNKLSSILSPYRNGKNSESSLKLSLPYALDSRLIFTGAKQKIFFLSGEHGLDLVDQISEQIRNQSSEFRLLPELPETESGMVAQALLATPDASLQADALRKADVVSVRRYGVSLLLRDVECYARDLPSSTWKELRHTFYNLISRYVVTPQGFFDYSGYIHRVFGLMIACGDFSHALDFIKDLENVSIIVRRTTTAGRTDRYKFKKCLSYHASALYQVAMQATTVRRFRFDKNYMKIINELKVIDPNLKIVSNLNAARTLSLQLLKSDWGRRPYKDYWFYANKEETENPRLPKAYSVHKVLMLNQIRRFREKALLKRPYWPALTFPTRPLSLAEILLISPSLLENQHELESALLCLRGARTPGELLGYVFERNNEEPQYVAVEHKFPKNVRVAIASVETTDQQWVKSVKSIPDLSLKRYINLRGTINRILTDNPKPDYIVFPECSIPMRWALGIGLNLARNRISFLCGLEYRNTRTSRLVMRNDALISLVTTWPGYSTNICMTQPKLEPSHDERRNLKEIANKTLFAPHNPQACRPIYIHGGFCFGVLLCSDLTDIKNRHYFQGNVDALFLIEWNKDVNTFSALVESAALDLHAYIIQVNNRQYGDSRIRAPFKEEYARDVVRVKGGISNYHVIAEIDYLALRRYQSHRYPPRIGEFKPFPIGFKISNMRRVGKIIF